MILDQLEAPLVLAPLGGGPSTPELAAAVADAGGLGFVAAGYLSAGELEERIGRTRSLTDGWIGVNVFAPGPGRAEPASYQRYLERLRGWAAEQGVEVGEPRYSDDEWDAKVELLLHEDVRVVSFTFGCPDSEVVERFHDVGSEVWVSVTSPEEARVAVDAGADVLVVQGGEAGGHRASFQDKPELPVYGLLALLSLVRGEVELPLVASGGISTGRAVAAVLCAGARAAQIGTAFMLCPEAGTAEVHRAALRGREDTALTRAFTGRLARGIRNRFLTELSDDAPIAYPELHYVTVPMRRQAREKGNADLVNLWAGETYSLAREEPAREVVHRFVTEAQAALQEAGARLLSPSNGRAVDRRALEDLAEDWYDAWNAHDLERVLDHYSEDILFSSPFISALGSDPSGMLAGKARLRDYWSRALERFPDLCFEPIAAFFGAASVTLHYRGIHGIEAAEVMELGPDGLIRRATAHYNHLP